MSTWSAGELVTRVREVLEGAAGALRTISAGTFAGKLPPGLEANEEARRALNLDGLLVPTEFRIVSMRRSPASPPVIGNLALYDIEGEARQVYPFTSLEKNVDASRDAVQGLAAENGDVIAQALTYPGNLTTTSGGKATGLVSGMFAYVGSDYSWAGTVNGNGGTLVALHKFKGVAHCAPAV